MKTKETFLLCYPEVPRRDPNRQVPRSKEGRGLESPSGRHRTTSELRRHDHPLLPSCMSSHVHIHNKAIHVRSREIRIASSFPIPSPFPSFHLPYFSLLSALLLPSTFPAPSLPLNSPRELRERCKLSKRMREQPARSPNAFMQYLV